MSLLITGATVIDGISQYPLEGHSVWIEDRRIKAVGRPDELSVDGSAKVIDARGKYLIPGLLNANVHLLCEVHLEHLVRHMGHYEELIVEAAQVALKNGLTTVFDTWGPRRFLMSVRDRINAGEVIGSRILCAGNIIGFDGPLSPDFDFFSKGADVASACLTKRINAIWVENVGRHLMWLSPEQVAGEVRAYIAKGIDFVKYGSNEHFGKSAGAFLAFSSRVQAAIVGEAHRAGLTAQAHTMTVEGLRVAIDAGCDLIQHANNTGPVPIPETTLELLVARGTGAVVFPQTQRRLEWLAQNESYRTPTMWQTADTNVRNLIRSGARLLMANDGVIFAPETLADAKFSKNLGGPWDENLFSLAAGHFVWLKAMEEKGCPPMQMLQAATRNVALAYGVDSDLGTIEPGKFADMLILDKNPLEAAENYRSIHAIIKDGAIVDRSVLPVKPILTAAMEPPVEEEACYVPFIRGGTVGFPPCPTCIEH